MLKSAAHTFQYISSQNTLIAQNSTCMSNEYCWYWCTYTFVPLRHNHHYHIIDVVIRLLYVVLSSSLTSNEQFNTFKGLENQVNLKFIQFWGKKKCFVHYLRFDIFVSDCELFLNQPNHLSTEISYCQKHCQW